MTHGGARIGAGRPSVLIDEKRMMTLTKQGVSWREIAKRFGVPLCVIQYRVTKIKQAALNIPQPD